MMGVKKATMFPIKVHQYLYWSNTFRTFRKNIYVYITLYVCMYQSLTHLTYDFIGIF